MSPLLVSLLAIATPSGVNLQDAPQPTEGRIEIRQKDTIDTANSSLGRVLGRLNQRVPSRLNTRVDARDDPSRSDPAEAYEADAASLGALQDTQTLGQGTGSFNVSGSILDSESFATQGAGGNDNMSLDGEPVTPGGTSPQ